MRLAVSSADRLLRHAVALTLALCCAAGAGHPLVVAQGAQVASLKIVVIAGEDAVNIIQQKTAVNPVVEVRDRNDLPVAGVPVTFTIGGPNAAFGSGLRTVTVTTNAAGRAAVTSLDPVGSGAVQINVSATYQGQAATATIMQTNFETVAAAAQAGATVGTAGAAGAATAAGAGAAAGGGGLSGLAIAGIIGGAGAAAVIGAKAAGVVGSAPPCTFSVSPTSVALSSAGGNVSITVTHAPNDCEPKDWTATSNAPFITGGMRAGETTMVFVEINPAGNPPRTGTISIAGQTVTVTQAARCAFAVSPSSLSLPGLGGTATVTVTASPAGCEQASWTASTISNFVTLSPTSGTGSGTVTVAVPANPFFTPLTGNLSIAGLTVSFVQGGSGAAACLAQRVQGGDVPETRTIELGRGSGRLLFRYDTGPNSEDRIAVTYEGRTIFDSGCVSTAVTRMQPLNYSGRSTTVTVQVTPNCRGGSGSTWYFEISCSP